MKAAIGIWIVSIPLICYGHWYIAIMFFAIFLRLLWEYIQYSKFIKVMSYIFNRNWIKALIGSICLLFIIGQVIYVIINI